MRLIIVIFILYILYLTIGKYFIGQHIKFDPAITHPASL